MGERAEQLAGEFDQANQELIACIESVSDDELRHTCGGDERSVAVLAHHVASGYVPISEWVQTIANGQPISVDLAMVHDANRAHAEANANISRDDILAALRTNGVAALTVLRGLTDEQLARVVPITLFGGQDMSAADVADKVLIGHVRAHLSDIRGAIENRG